MNKFLARTMAAGVLSLAAIPAFSTLPLITDDTETQRPNDTTHQFEFSYDRLRDNVSGTTTRSAVPGFTYTYGISDPLDVFVETSHARATADNPFSRVSGPGDTGVGIKWRFYDKDNLSFAVKPQINFATGDENKALGTGRTSGAVALLMTYEAAPVTWLANIVYMRNNYKLPAAGADNRSDLVRVSAAALVKVHEKVRLFSDIGRATNPDRTSNTAPTYFLTGMIYSPNKDIDFNLGVKFGTSQPETDRTWSIGATFRY